MMSELGRLAEEGLLRPPLCTENPPYRESVREALENAMLPFIGRKQLIRMSPLSTTVP